MKRRLSLAEPITRMITGGPVPFVSQSGGRWVIMHGYLQRQISRDHFVYAPNQWETTLHCNFVSHWLGTYTKWSLDQWWICSCHEKQCLRQTISKTAPSQQASITPDSGLGFFRPKPVSSGQNGKNWIKPVLSSFFRPKLSKTDQNWTKQWTVWSKWSFHWIIELHFSRSRAKHKSIANAPKISHCSNNGTF